MKKIVAIVAVAGLAAGGAWFVTSEGSSSEQSVELGDEVKFADFVEEHRPNGDQGSGGAVKHTEEEQASGEDEPRQASADEAASESAEAPREAPTDIRVLGVERDDAPAQTRSQQPQAQLPIRDFANVDGAELEDEMRADNQFDPEVIERIDIRSLQPKVPTLPKGLENIQLPDQNGRQR